MIYAILGLTPLVVFCCFQIYQEIQIYSYRKEREEIELMGSLLKQKIGELK
tara:strand:+ start:1109 stop:1261 length:153 start_codon:yes stop_codon:yes gene_type:complete